MRQRLRRVAQCAVVAQIVLLRKQADIIAQGQQPLEQRLGLRVAAEQLKKSIEPSLPTSAAVRVFPISP